MKLKPGIFSNKKPEKGQNIFSPEQEQPVGREDILSFSSSYRTPELTSDDVALRNLLNRLENRETVVRQKPVWKIYAYAASSAAAVILLFLGLYGYFHRERITTIITSGAQQTSVFLPDSSEVIMNASSKISYNQAQWKTQRTLKLDGEAFFKVKKGSRFEVVSKHCTTEVLGTSFNIFSRDNRYAVSCFTGKVWVKTADQSSGQILTPGFETLLTDNKKLIFPQKFVAGETATWQKGEFYFRNEPLVNVIHELERQFNVNVVASDVENRNFTGCFFKNNLQQALKLVCDPMQLSYAVDGNKVLIRAK
ncbi:MAG TPA: FecR domain-containing protein [Bacteroidales bacterium]